jgi:FtsH-binding integral membrane protein
MFGYTKVSSAKGGGDVEVDLELGGSSTLYPGISLGENQLRWGFIRKVYGILATQLIITTIVSAITILYTPVNEVLKANPGFLLFLMFLPLVCTLTLTPDPSFIKMKIKKIAFLFDSLCMCVC